MKKLTIYNVSVEMQDQAQCDRMKQLCIDNGLSIGMDILWDYTLGESFSYFNTTKTFFIMFIDNNDQNTKVTEQEFIELLKNK